jgi:lysozyme
MKNTLKLSIFIVGLGLLLIIGLFYTGDFQMNAPSIEDYPIRGIDVSHHQNKINWEIVQQDSTIRFAFIKATEGENFKDPAFDYNWSQAKANGIDIGAYHFFTFCKSGTKQANNFIQSVPYDSLALPPVIDLEFGGNCQLIKEDSTIIKAIDTLQVLLTKQYHKKPIFYVTQDFYQRFSIGSQFPFNPIWVRDIYHSPALYDGRGWILWQYSNRGQVHGIETYVDLNVFRGSEKAYQTLKKVPFR